MPACYSSALLGQALLFLSLMTSGLSCFFSRGGKYWLHGTVAGITCAFILLLYAHITSDFTYLNVVEHSHTAKPLLYKIAGVWGNHEGSMLLWVLFLSLYALGSYKFLPQDLGDKVARILLALIFGFLLFMILACDPFQTVAELLVEGEDLNPILQDPSLAIHPPCLYAGYTGLSVPFALSLVVLLKEEFSTEMARLMRGWTLIAWSFLTLGLGLGSFWAYYELGWGGWWFWDPVENAALMPWLAATAFFHCLIVVEKQQALQRWSLFMGILSFSLCLFSLFFVRSGLLTSVHSFAVDPDRGALLLSLMLLTIVPAFFVWIKKGKKFKKENTLSLNTRPGMMMINSLILMCGLATILLAIIYPLILEHFGQTISIGTPYFKSTFIPMTLPLLFFAGIGAWFAYQEKSLMKVIEKVLPAFSAAVLSTLLCGWLLETADFLAFMGVALAVWLMANSLLYFYSQHFKRSSLAMTLAHFGLGLMVFGMVWASYGEVEKQIHLRINERVDLAGYSVTLEKLEEIQGPNYTANRALLRVKGKNSTTVTLLAPEKRYYWTQKIIHGETAIYSGFFSHLYSNLLTDEHEPYLLRISYKPLINFIWLGVSLMIGGGFLSLITRRWSSVRDGALMLIICLQIAVAGDSEQQARSLYKEILCPVCAGQSLEDSDTDVAILMKSFIRESLHQGKTKQEIIQELKSVYGEGVSRSPSLSLKTLPLWIIPWALLFGGIFAMVYKRRRLKLR